MYAVRRTAEFIAWLDRLRDRRARARIAVRIERIAEGNLGDHRSVGGGVSELRLAFGPGYRLYFTRRGDTVIVLLCGGDKASQETDIAHARRMALEIE